MSDLDAFVNVNKPAGCTSRAVVDRVARSAGTRRVGHAGTLDPAATGVLVIAIGKATRLVEYVQRMPKTYEAEFLLGATSNTDDLEGQVVAVQVDTPPSLETIRAALDRQVGEVLQRPPAFSALKLEGRRAYRLARRGEEVALAPRPVTIHAIDLLAYTSPRLLLRIQCGSGTYIRSIARDLGEQLGVGGLMSGLVRRSVGVYRLEDAFALETVEGSPASRWARPLAEAVSILPRAELDLADADRLELGQSVPWAEGTPGEWAVFEREGRFVGIAELAAGSTALRPHKLGFRR